MKHSCACYNNLQLAMSVHYKFKTSLNYDTVTFDGLHISVSDLKKAIMQQKKIGKSSDFDLEITNAQTKQVYNTEDDLIPKNTSVIVCRVPVASGNKKNWERPELPLPADDEKPSGSIRFDRSIKNADLANSNVTEDDKVKAMINQSSQEYDPSKYVKSRSMTGPLPPTYTCYRCGKQGHWIKNCPTNNPDVKRSTGIPRSFMVHVDGPEHKGALLTSSGEFAVPIIDQQAYKEVKKEKPPFVPEPTAPSELGEEIPEELLCMICKNLLQHAVLTPCCANSFCDDCIRQNLIESSTHECPVCHETDILPNTVIPNRFLRTAVANFNGDTEVRRLFSTPPMTEVPKIDSPQPSPDSTVETQPPVVDSTDCKPEIPAVVPDNIYDQPIKTEPPDIQIKAEQEVSEKNPEEIIELTQPGTPLADELEEDVTHPMPIQTGNQAQYDEYPPGSYSDRPIESYEHDSGDSSDQRPISVIGSTINFRKTKFPSRLPPMMSRQNYSSNHHRLDHSDYETRDRSDYPSRYDNRNNDRPLAGRTAMRPHPRYERQPHDNRYHHSEGRPGYHNYKTNHNHDKEYGLNSAVEQPRRRSRYPSTNPTANLSVPPPYPPEGVGSYSQPVPVAPLQVAVHLSSSQQTFPAQPPPPGASPSDTLSHIPPQPPPPGVGPLLPTPPLSQKSELSTFTTQIFNVKENQGQPEEQSIDDRIEAFQRELQKRDRESARERSRSSSRSRTRNRSRSTSRSSHSRSYNSSKSWTRSASRSVSRSRSRSRSTYSSRRSRSRSFSRSRSHSRSKSRSVTRSQTRSRSKSRSRSRERRRSLSRERLPTPYSREHSASHSPSPRNFNSRMRRSPFPLRRNINPPSYMSNYTPQYTGPPALPIPTPYPPAHIQSIHTIQPPLITHPIGHSPPDRQRYQYPEPYGGYAYQHQPKPYNQPRFEREPRNQRFESHNYNRHEEVPHRIPGWVGDRTRHDQKLRYRVPRDQQRKEIKELPKVPEFQVPPLRAQKFDVRVKESREESVAKKKEEKPQVVKHKKHHHHRTKEIKKSEKHETKVTYEDRGEENKEASNLIGIDAQPLKEVTSKKLSTELKMKSSEKKEKKHKHKKHKLLEEGGKKRKVPKKEKVIDETATGKVKTKKKKNKLKAASESKKEKANLKQHQKIPVVVCEPQVENINLVISQNTETVSEHKLQVSHDEEKIINVIEPMENINQEPEMEGAEEQTALDFESGHADAVEFQETLESEINSDVLPQDGDEVKLNERNENADEEFIDDEEENEELPAEDVLRVEVPELSKWEREEYEEDTLLKPLRKNAVQVPKEEKGPLSSDIIQRAEKVILQKPLKTSIVVSSTKERLPQKVEKISVNADDVPPVRTAKPREHTEPKPVTSIEKTVAPTLQVTISTNKEKRSVQTKENARKDESKSDSHSKRVKLDRSHFSSVASSTKLAETSHRTVLVEHSSSESKRHDDKQKAGSERVKSRSSETKPKEKISYSRKEEHAHSSDYSRDAHHKERRYVVEDRRQRETYDSKRQTEAYDSKRQAEPYDSRRQTEPYDSRRQTEPYDSRRQTERYERNRHNPSDQGGSRDRRYPEPTVTYRNEERRDVHYRRSRSRSSSESYEHKQRSRKVIEPQYDRSYTRTEEEDDYEKGKSSHRVPRREHEKKIVSQKDNVRDVSGKTQSKHISHDESKFEPNYDEFSEDEAESNVFPEKRKRPIDGPGISGKRPKYQKVEITIPSRSDNNKFKTKESSTPSSVTTSSSSDTDSSLSLGLSLRVQAETKVHRSKTSDADQKQKHKKSRHKKHKKHKHKHKKKKSHKTKQKD